MDDDIRADKGAFWQRCRLAARSWLGRIRPLDLIYPAACPACHRMTASHRGLCASCWPQLRFIERPYCEVLGTPFSVDLGAGILSAEAIAHPPPFDRCRAALVHSGPARKLAHALKYSDRTDLATMMATWMKRAGGEWLSPGAVIVPVPLHRTRLFLRQYNQAAELARALASQSGLALLPCALERVRPTRRQVGLSRQARQANLAAAFRVTQSGQSDLFGRRVILVDDVYTTGATAKAASRALRKAGATDITVLTFAMALPDTI